jgi:ribosomal protein S18 acetylase RimI-like enzyme
VSVVCLAAADDLGGCLEIVRRLRDYFTPDVPEKVRSNFARCRSWVVVDDGKVAGFAVVDELSSQTAEILWAAVDPDQRGSGLGTRLIEDILETLRAGGVRLVEVKTLDPGAEYKPYEATIAFWEGRGFLKIDVLDPLPGWPAGNPCAIYVAPLAP